MSSIVLKRSSATKPQAHAKGSSVAQLLISSIILASFLAVVTIAMHLQPTATAAPVTPRTPAVIKPAIAKPHKTPAAAPAPTVVRSIAPQNCTPNAEPAAPTAINLSNAPNGLTQITDSPHYYRIFGNTPAQMQAQLQKCAPLSHSGETFAAEAGYTITWKYTTQSTSDGTCNVSNVKVGLHTNMILPAWSATDQAMAGLTGKWKKFISNLKHHENGHIALDRQYADQLLSDLQNQSADTCTALKADLRTKAKVTIASLDAANIAYDEHTDHGTTQGAILP